MKKVLCSAVRILFLASAINPMWCLEFPNRPIKIPPPRRSVGISPMPLLWDVVKVFWLPF